MSQVTDLASRFVDVERLPWQKTPFAGIEFKPLLVDKASGVMTLLMRMAPGVKLPDHEHVEIEQTYVLEGSLMLAMFQLPNKFFQKDGRETDFLGNDWQKAWGRAR